MTENEALESALKKVIAQEKSDWGYIENFDVDENWAVRTAIEQVQQYRKIGTVEECRKSVEICKSMIERNITPENMEEYMKFEDECVKNGFTFNSLLEAREKQTAKKIEIFNGQASCPNCKHLFGGMDIIKNLITWDMPHCKNCGQRLDWSDEE